MNRTILIACSVLMLLTLQGLVQAQRGGSSDFRQRMMERMDRNGDGKLDESEVPEGRARDFVQGMSRQAGGDGRFPLSISSISGGSSDRGRGGGDRGRGGDRGSDRGRDRGRGGDDRSRRGQEEEKEFEYSLVPRFGATIGGFGLDPRQLNNRMVDIEATYDDGVLRQLNQTMERYDKDKDGVLDYKEWEGIPWQSDPRESDLNKDGNLTRAEMAERYRKTTASRSSASRSRDRGSSNDRGSNDRGSNDRGSSDRGGSERGSRGGDRGGRGGDRGGGRGGDRGGGDRGGGDRGGRGGGAPSFGGRGGFDPSSMITRLDKNGDGYIDFDKEVDERTKSFASRFLPRYGIEVKGKQKLSSIVNKIQGGRSSSSASSSGNDKKKKGPANPEMVASQRTTGADKFGQHTYRREQVEVKEDVEDWFEDKDRNGDGQVTMGEYLQKNPTETAIKEFNKFDDNRDGILVPNEALKPSR